MTKRIAASAAAFAVVAAVCLGQAALAQNPPPFGPAPFGPPPFGPPPFGRPPGGQGGPGGPMAMLPPGLMAPIPRGMRELDLTDSQRVQVRQILDDFRNAHEADMQELGVLLRQERAAGQSATFDAEIATELAAHEVALTDRLTLAAQTARANIVGTVLTADQRAGLADGRPPQSAPLPNPPSAEDMASRLAQRLGLSSDQESKVRTIVSDRIGETKASQDKLKSIWDSYFQSNPPGTYDASALSAALDRSKSPRIDALTNRMKSQAAIWSVLTPDQRTEFASMPPPNGPDRGPDGGFGPPPPGGPGGGFGPPPPGGPDGGFGPPPPGAPNGGFGPPPPGAPGT